jgi:hypothetical protein
VDIAPMTTPIPVNRFLRRRCGTRRPSSRHSLRTRLSLTSQPARRAILAARRHPQRGRSVENRRSQARNSASSVLIGGRRQALRGAVKVDHGAGALFGNPETFAQGLDSAKLRLRFGVRRLPPRSPSAPWFTRAVAHGVGASCPPRLTRFVAVVVG